jgi:hypothetical protein
MVIDIGGSYMHMMSNIQRDEHVSHPVTQAKQIELTEY